MVKKLKATTSSKKTGAPLKGSVKDSAQQIWQAGLGAFNKAQAEGSKAFEALVKEGVSLQRKTQSVAEEKISETASKMSTMANGISYKASGQWDKLESIFEERVAKALNKLGVPSAQDLAALIERIEALNKSVQRLSAKGVAPKAASKATVKTSTKPAITVSVKRAKKVPVAAEVASNAMVKPARKRAPTRKAAAVKATADTM